MQIKLMLLLLLHWFDKSSLSAFDLPDNKLNFVWILRVTSGTIVALQRICFLFIGPHFLAFLTTLLLNTSKNLVLSNCPVQLCIKLQKWYHVEYFISDKKNIYTSTDVIINQYAKNTPLGHTGKAIYKQIIFCSDVIIHKTNSSLVFLS